MDADKEDAKPGANTQNTGADDNVDLIAILSELKNDIESISKMDWRDSYKKD